jgi:hypothetical protein
MEPLTGWGRCAVQRDRKFRTELGFSHVRQVPARASVGAGAAVSRRGCSGSVTYSGGEQLAEFDPKFLKGGRAPSAWSAPVVSR